MGALWFCILPAAVSITANVFAPAGRCRRVVTSALTPQTVFNVVTLAVMPLYGLMVAFPRKPLVREAVFVPGSALGHANNLQQLHSCADQLNTKACRIPECNKPCNMFCM